MQNLQGVQYVLAQSGYDSSKCRKTLVDHSALLQSVATVPDTFARSEPARSIILIFEVWIQQKS